jgi:hypothetical protein
MQDEEPKFEPVAYPLKSAFNTQFLLTNEPPISKAWKHDMSYSPNLAFLSHYGTIFGR